jgi:hypothetical protein
MSASSPRKAQLVDAASRRIAARTMDGFKVCAKIALQFPAELSRAEAEAALDVYARAFAQSLEDEISNGRLPVDDGTLHERITSRVAVAQRHRVRLSELHVAQAETSQTLPAVSQPPLPGAAPSLRPPLSGAQSQLPPSSLLPPSSRLPAPSQYPLMSSAPPSLHAPLSSMPPVGPASGIAPSQPYGQRATGGFAVALERSVRHMLPAEVGDVLAEALRDAAGSVLLHALDCLRDHVADPMRLLDGRLDPQLRRALVAESSACVAYLLLDSLTSAGIPQKVGVVVTQAAAARAVSGQPVPGAEISRYLALANPAFEFARRLCDLFVVAEPSDLQPRIGFALASVRADARQCAERLRARAVRPNS